MALKRLASEMRSVSKAYIEVVTESREHYDSGLVVQSWRFPDPRALRCEIELRGYATLDEAIEAVRA